MPWFIFWENEKIAGIRCTSIWTQLSYQFLNWPKVVPWIVLWKNSFELEVALKLWSRQAAQVSLNFSLTGKLPNGVSRRESPFEVSLE